MSIGCFGELAWHSHRSKIYRVKLLSLIFLLGLANVSNVFGASDTTRGTTTCDLDKPTFRRAATLAAKAMMDYDPGPDVMLDMDSKDGCILRELNCSTEKDSLIIEFVQDCRLVYEIPGQYKSDKQTGKRKAFSIRIRMAKDGKMSIVK